MKKFILFGAAAIMMAGSATAQISLVKDLAKHAASSKLDDLKGVLTNIAPALTNPESANDVLTWYTAGKAAFGVYDELYKQKLMQQPVDNAEMTKALTDGFTYYQKALTLDTIVETNKDGSIKYNKDGSKKVKTKYSKDIVSVLTGHVGDIANVGNECLQNNDWAGAAAAFGNYADIASSPLAIANGVNADAETMSQVRFFQGYSQYQIQDYANAYDNFTKARNLGYTDNNIVDFQTSSLANLVQTMLDNKEYDKAYNFIDNAMAGDPNNATLHDIKGFTKELELGVDEALPYYLKATEVDPTYANAQFDVGRCYYLQAQKIIDDNPNATTKELVPKVKPLYDKAIPYLKKALELNPENTKSKSVLDDIDYKLSQMQ